MIVKNADLIQSLARDLTPVAPGHTRDELLLGLAVGGAASLSFVMLVYGVQPGLLSFAHGGPLLLKATYALSLAGIAGSMLLPMARAHSATPTKWRLFALLALILAGIAMTQSALLPIAEWRSLWFGASWNRCPFRVAALSLPVFAGLCWAIRRQAPLRLRAAGAVAGLLSGGIAATLYALACSEDGAGFVLVWYTLGIAISTGIGALLGPKVLRW